MKRPNKADYFIPGEEGILNIIEYSNVQDNYIDHLESIEKQKDSEDISTMTGEEFLQSKDIWNHPFIQATVGKEEPYPDYAVDELLEEYAAIQNTVEKGLSDQKCMYCGNMFAGEDPKYCCDGKMCGCGGQPIDPVVCSTRCFNDLMNKNSKSISNALPSDEEIDKMFPAPQQSPQSTGVYQERMNKILGAKTLRDHLKQKAN